MIKFFEMLLTYNDINNIKYENIKELIILLNEKININKYNDTISSNDNDICKYEFFDICLKTLMLYDLNENKNKKINENIKTFLIKIKNNLKNEVIYQNLMY